MKIQFDDKSYIEIKKTEDNKIILIISAKDQANPLKRVTNSVELDMKQFKDLIASIN